MIPDLSVLWVILVVLLLTVIVSKLLFQPILRVVAEREGAVVKARALAEQAERRAEAAKAEYEAQIGAARSEVYRQLDATRRAAIDRRNELLALTRREVDESRADAIQRINDAADAARSALHGDAAVLSQSIVERILDRKVS